MQAPFASVVHALSPAGTNTDVAPFEFVSDAVTFSFASGVHVPSTTDFSKVIVRSWLVPASFASFGGLIEIRTFTHVLDASGFEALAETAAPSTRPSSEFASTTVVPAVGELIVTMQVPFASVVHALS